MKKMLLMMAGIPFVGMADVLPPPIDPPRLWSFAAGVALVGMVVCGLVVVRRRHSRKTK